MMKKERNKLSALKLTALALGVSLVGVVGGAAIAAPDQIGPASEAILRASAHKAITVSSNSWEFVNTTASQIRTADLSKLTPRQLGISIAALATVLLATAALILARKNQNGRQSRQLGHNNQLARNTITRRSNSRPTPKQVRSLAEKGSSVLDIARRTGLPVDAVSLLLSVSDPSRQLPPTSA